MNTQQYKKMIKLLGHQLAGKLLVDVLRVYEEGIGGEVVHSEQHYGELVQDITRYLEGKYKAEIKQASKGSAERCREILQIDLEDSIAEIKRGREIQEKFNDIANGRSQEVDT